MKNLLFGSLLAVAMLSLSGCYGTADSANAAVKTTKSACNTANCNKGMKCGAGKCGEGKKAMKCGTGKCGDAKKTMKCGAGKCGKDMKKPAAKCGGGKCGSGK